MYFKNAIIASAIAATALLSGCASQPELQKTTTSGKAEAMFATSPEETSALLMNGCIDKGYYIENADKFTVVCAKDLSGNQAMVATMMLGNSYSSNPTQKIRFMMIPKSEQVRVTAYQWVQLQMAGGAVNRTELNHNKHRNSIQDFMTSLGGV